MAKAGVDLKGITAAIDRVTEQVKGLQKEPATRAAKSEMSALRRALRDIRTLVAEECPPGMFRAFDLGEATAGRRARTRPTRKSTRK